MNTVSPPSPPGFRLGLLAITLSAFVSYNAQAQDGGIPATGKPYIDMDYGAFLGATIEAAPGNIAQKGIAIRLDQGPGGAAQGNAFALFETDTLRYAGFWTGRGLIDWHGIALDGKHGAHPRIIGDLQLGNPNAPGWADPETGGFSDPRLRSVDRVAYGPLPRSWAHWKGLHRQGQRVVLEYTVGATRVREQPRLITVGTQKVLERVIEVGPSTRPLVLQVAGDATGVVQVVDGKTGKPTDAAGSSAIAVLTTSRAPTRGQIPLSRDFTISAWIRTRSPQGTIFSKAALSGPWVPKGKTFFIRGGRLGFDVGWVGVVTGQRTLNDGKWHHVSVTYSHKTGRTRLYLDGKPDGAKPLKSPDDTNHIIRLGYTATNFMTPLKGALDEVQFFQRTLSDAEILRLSRDEEIPASRVARWSFDEKGSKSGQVPGAVGNVIGGGYAGSNQGGRLVTGHKGLALEFNGKAQVRIGPRRATRPQTTVDWQSQAVVAAIVLGPGNSRWLNSGKALRLKIPSSRAPQRISVLAWRSPGKTTLATAVTLRQTPPRRAWDDLADGGPTQWKQTVTTKLNRGDADDKDPLAIDEITLPTSNPWRSWMRLGGFDYFSDASRAAVCTWQGDVWIVSGLGKSLDSGKTAGQLTWKRIAAGLFQSLGLKIVDDRIYVLGRDQITRLVDLNNDGETDFYENFNNDAQVTEHFHEFAMDLQTDKRGNFYYMKGARHALPAVIPQHGSVIRVSADGSTSQVLANGFRAPNGLALNDDGSFISTDQEGHWTPMNRINWIRRGGFYGNMMSYVPGKKDTSYDPPLCWIHKQTDRSPSAPVWVTSDKWALPRGSLLSLSYGTGRIWRVVHERVGEIHQGGITRLPLPELPTGIHRGRFHPDDGQLYICGLFGWSSNKTRPGGLYRIRATGKPLDIAEGLSAVPSGLVIRFPRPLDKKQATDAGRYSIQRWNYRRAASYGSRDYKVSDGTQGRDRVEVTGVQLSRDGRAVLLGIADMKPCMQMRVHYNIATAEGTPVAGQIEHTINVVNGPTHLASLGFDPAGAPVPRVRMGPPRKDLKAGLVLAANAGPLHDARVSRLAALAVEPGDSISPRLTPGAFTASLEGLLDVELTDTYTFSADGSGDVTLSINGDVVLDQPGGTRGRSVAVALNAGLNELHLEYRSPGRGLAQLRLHWQSPRFARELIPSRVLWHSVRHPELARWSAVGRGRSLFATHRCAHCHSAQGTKLPTRPAISLDAATFRFNRNWMTHWMANPPAMRNHTRMPAMFGTSATEIQALRDVLAYLTQFEIETVVPPAGDVARGERRWEQLGCIACHTFAPAAKADDWDRTSLHMAASKYSPGSLGRFLAKPHQFHPQSRMPDFKLTETETKDLVALIHARSRGRLKQRLQPRGNAGLGKQQFVSRGCLSCHGSQLAEVDKLKPLDPVQLTFGKQTSAGCLAETPRQAAGQGRVPVYGFSRQQRADLSAFLASGPDRSPGRSPLEFVADAMRRLRCAACHDRDTAVSPRREIIAEESELGMLPGVLPDLTWAGEKLKTGWAARLLGGRLKHPSRPWLKARMPSFGAWGDRLARGLAAEHGVSIEAAAGPGPERTLAEIGARLTLKQGGFNCLQCHGVGRKPALAPFDNRGVNFSRVRDRLRYGFYLDWMFDPLRLDPHSKMPRFSPDRKTTSVGNLLDGDARKQFDALWHFLQAVQDN